MTKKQIVKYLEGKIEDYSKRIKRDEMCMKMQETTEDEKREFEAHRLHLIYASNLAFDVIEKLK